MLKNKSERRKYKEFRKVYLNCIYRVSTKLNKVKVSP